MVGTSGMGFGGGGPGPNIPMPKKKKPTTILEEAAVPVVSTTLPETEPGIETPADARAQDAKRRRRASTLLASGETLG